MWLCGWFSPTDALKRGCGGIPCQPHTSLLPPTTRVTHFSTACPCVTHFHCPSVKLSPVSATFLCQTLPLSLLFFSVKPPLFLQLGCQVQILFQTPPSLLPLCQTLSLSLLSVMLSPIYNVPLSNCVPISTVSLSNSPIYQVLCTVLSLYQALPVSSTSPFSPN